MAKILIIEDDQALLKPLARWLAADGYAVETASDGKDALQMLQQYQFDVIVLDWELPSMSGVEILREFRRNGGVTPVIFLTGQTDLQHKKEGLDSGADDYLTKPFESEELTARIRSLLRRPPSVISNVITVGNVSVQIGTQNVTVDGATVVLGKREFGVLEFLMRRQNKAFSSQELMEAVWPSDTDSSEDAVRACMRVLRKKITSQDGNCIIDTIHGAGYIIRGDK
jgi:DNA-binding response OmpR family regulator